MTRIVHFRLRSKDEQTRTCVTWTSVVTWTSLITWTSVGKIICFAICCAWSRYLYFYIVLIIRQILGILYILFILSLPFMIFALCNVKNKNRFKFKISSHVLLFCTIVVNRLCNVVFLGPHNSCQEPNRSNSRSGKIITMTVRTASYSPSGWDCLHVVNSTLIIFARPARSSSNKKWTIANRTTI